MTRCAAGPGQEGDGPEPGSSRIRSGRAGGCGPGARAWVPCTRRRARSTLWVRQTYQVRATIASSTAIAAQNRASRVSASVMSGEEQEQRRRRIPRAREAGGAEPAGTAAHQRDQNHQLQQAEHQVGERDLLAGDEDE